MPLARGTAAVGYITLLGIFLAAGMPITAPIPQVSGLTTCAQGCALVYGGARVPTVTPCRSIGLRRLVATRANLFGTWHSLLAVAALERTLLACHCLNWCFSLELLT